MNFRALTLPFRMFKRYRMLRENEVSRVFLYAKVIIRRGRGNRIVAYGLSPEMASKCRIKLSGNNNTVEIGNISIKNCLRISVGGSGNHVVLNDGIYIFDTLDIAMWKECAGGRVAVGRDTTFWETSLRNYDSGSSVVIGEDCMFSKQVVVSNTDEHAVLVDGRVINRAGRLEIGRHVWVGQGASVMKNSRVPDGCIVARNAVVCHAVFPKASVLAGVPARAVKEGIDWSRASVNEFGSDTYSDRESCRCRRDPGETR